jgi:hypothetical protein
MDVEVQKVVLLLKAPTATRRKVRHRPMARGAGSPQAIAAQQPP